MDRQARQSECGRGAFGTGRDCTCSGRAGMESNGTESMGEVGYGLVTQARTGCGGGEWPGRIGRQGLISLIHLLFF